MDLRIDPILTTRQLADAIGASESSVKRWVDRGEIGGFRTAGGHRRIPVAEAVGFLRRTGAPLAKPRALGLAWLPQRGPADHGAAERLFESLREDDTGSAGALITGRFLSGAGVAEIGDQMIRPALARIGELWLDGPEGILFEHRAVDTCVRVVSRLSDWLPAIPRGAPSAVSAAGPTDPYILPPLLAGLTLRECGVRARNLGPLAPAETIALAVERYGVSACALSFSVPAGDEAAWALLFGRLDAGGALLFLGGRAAGSLPGWLSRRGRVCASLTGLRQLACETLGLRPATPDHQRSEEAP